MYSGRVHDIEKVSMLIEFSQRIVLFKGGNRAPCYTTLPLIYEIRKCFGTIPKALCAEMPLDSIGIGLDNLLVILGELSAPRPGRAEEPLHLLLWRTASSSIPSNLTYLISDFLASTLRPNVLPCKSSNS